MEFKEEESFLIFFLVFPRLMPVPTIEANVDADTAAASRAYGRHKNILVVLPNRYAI